MTVPEVSEQEISEGYDKLFREAEEGSYHLNPDVPFTRNLVRGLIINEKRFGYQACPCRLAAGKRDEDLDIICPCDYRDPDLVEYGTCYCGLYVSDEIRDGSKKAEQIPERRGQDHAMKDKKELPEAGMTDLAYPVWRCKVCGYLCAREQPPLVCPVCRAKQERFERFL
jgi:ferredoxin-thioredoxin reductase catalytic chain